MSTVNDANTRFDDEATDVVHFEEWSQTEFRTSRELKAHTAKVLARMARQKAAERHARSVGEAVALARHLGNESLEQAACRLADGFAVAYDDVIDYEEFAVMVWRAIDTYEHEAR